MPPSTPASRRALRLKLSPPVAAPRRSRRDGRRGCVPMLPSAHSPGPLFEGAVVEVQRAGQWATARVANTKGSARARTIRVTCELDGEDVILSRSETGQLRLPEDVSRALDTIRALSESGDAAPSSASSRRERHITEAADAAQRAEPRLRRRPFTMWRNSTSLRLPTSTNLFLDLFSGPFKSFSQSVNQHISNALCVTTDVEPRFCPDFVADFRTFDLWGCLYDHCASDLRGRLHLFLHIHASPPCKCPTATAKTPPRLIFTTNLATAATGTTYVLVNNSCNLRSPLQPAATARSRPEALVADQLVRLLAFYVRQCHNHQLPTTFSIENPVASMMWNLPCMQQLVAEGLLYFVDVDYCMYGFPAAKPTRFAVSPALYFRRHEWARRCSPGAQCCGATRRASPSARAYHTGPLSHKLVHSAIPSLLCSNLSVCCAQIHSGMRNLSRAYGTINACTALQLRREWQMKVATVTASPVTAGCPGTPIACSPGATAPVVFTAGARRGLSLLIRAAACRPQLECEPTTTLSPEEPVGVLRVPPERRPPSPCAISSDDESDSGSSDTAPPLPDLPFEPVEPATAMERRVERSLQSPTGSVAQRLRRSFDAAARLPLPTEPSYPLRALPIKPPFYFLEVSDEHGVFDPDPEPCTAPSGSGARYAFDASLFALLAAADAGRTCKSLWASLPPLLRKLNAQPSALRHAEVAVANKRTLTYPPAEGLPPPKRTCRRLDTDLPA